MRTVLLLLVVAAAFGLYQVRRADSSPVPVAPRTAPAPLPEDFASPAHQVPPTGRPTSTEDSGPTEVLSANDRAVLETLHEEWRAAPPEWNVRPWEDADALRIAAVQIRSILREEAEERLAVSPGPIVVSRIELAGGEAMELRDIVGSTHHLEGRTWEGTSVRIPGRAVRSLTTVPEDEARRTWRTRTEERIERLSTGGPAERTTAIFLCAQLEDLERAEAMLPGWLDNAGPEALVAIIEDPERRALVDRAADRLRRVPTEVAAVPAAPRTPRAGSLEELRTFLGTARSGIRELDEKTRLQRADACLRWTEWLEESGDRLPLPAEEIAPLAERLRLLRYDLLKGSGF